MNMQKHSKSMSQQEHSEATSEPERERLKIVSEPEHSEILAEYASLRAEILQRIDLRQQILTFSLIAAGTILSIGVQPNITPLVLLIYPILAVPLAFVWGHHDVRIAEIANYLKIEIQPQLYAIKWEGYLPHRKFRSLEVAAIALFVLTDLLAVALAWQRLHYSTEEIILLAFDLLGVVTTIIYLLERNRMIHRKK